VFFVDAAKGALACLLAFLCFGYFNEPALIAMLSAGLSVVIGTMFPVLYKFRGSKAVSTMVGAAWFINPIILLILFFVFLALILIVRIVSVMSILGISSWVIWSIFNTSLYPIRDLTLTTTIMYCSFILIVLFNHRQNLLRISKWAEHRVSFKK
jgi:glycerol-3-phosphate acyltransferase PlsY